MWSGVVVLVVAGALALSVLVGTDKRDPDPEPGFDHTEFCVRVKAFKAITAGGLDLTQDMAKVRRLADALNAVTPVAPPTVKDAVADWAAGLYDGARKLELVVAKHGKDAPETMDEVQAVEANVGGEKEVSVDRVTNYVRKACGVDLQEELPAPETTDPTAGTTEGSTVDGPTEGTAPRSTAPPAGPDAPPASPAPGTSAPG